MSLTMYCWQVMDALVADKTLGANLAAPSISHGSENLYMRGVLEEATRDNLSKVSPPTSQPIQKPTPSGKGWQ